MRRRSIILFAVPVLLALGAGAWFLDRALAPRAPAAAPPQAQGARVETVGGATVVVVPVDMQRASGILAAPLAAVQVRPELRAYASVIDAQPLFDLGARLAAANAQVEAARARAGASAAQAARVRVLFRDARNASEKDLQEARAAAEADRAGLAAAEASQAGLAGGLRLQFGDALARAAASPDSGTWRALASGRAALLRVVLPANAAAPQRLDVDAPAGGVLAGRKLSAAPRVDPMLQGAAWFYLLPAALPAGTRTIAHLILDGRGTAGVLVPDAAIVWYADARWAYVRSPGERFTRRLVRAVAPAEGGVLATAGFMPGEQVVTRGAALLLSEEQKPRGVATQCKDPPECDD